MAIMGWLLCSFLAPIAWYMGEQLRERARMGGYPMPGPGNAGRILAKVQCILILVVLGLGLVGAVLVNLT